MSCIQSFDDHECLVIMKHSTIYLSPEKLATVQNTVSTVECALKYISD